MTLLEFIYSQSELWWAILKVALATVIGGIIGMERRKHGRAAGMRTHILVCLGATLTSMTGVYASSVLGFTGDPMRVAAQVISGIGFLGVGTILVKGRFQITGLTTAAGLWCGAAIGIALGIGYFEGAIVTFIAEVVVTTVLHRLEYKLTNRNSRFGIYLEIKSDKAVREILDMLAEKYPITDMQVTAPRSGTAGNVGIEANVHAYKLPNLTPNTMSHELEENESVIFAIESL